jgi:DNA-binding transcriptional regulator GbsR (MarR family)
LGAARQEMVETCGRLCQWVGMPRSMGQIYGLLYLTPQPLSLDEIADWLGLSKASVSIGTRHLISLHAIRQVWVPGVRRDHFEVQADLNEVLRANYSQFFKPKLEKSQRKVEALLEALKEDQASGVISEQEHALCRERLHRVLKLQGRLRQVLPLAERWL